jgi:hypothetical protein
MFIQGGRGRKGEREGIEGGRECRWEREEKIEEGGRDGGREGRSKGGRGERKEETGYYTYTKLDQSQASISSWLLIHCEGVGDRRAQPDILHLKLLERCKISYS